MEIVNWPQDLQGLHATPHVPFMEDRSQPRYYEGISDAIIKQWFTNVRMQVRQGSCVLAVERRKQGAEEAMS